MISWLTAYLFTVAIEMPFWAWGLRRAFPNGWALVGIAFGTSFVTHPVLWLTYSPTGSLGTGLLFAEGCVTFAEGSLLWGLWAYKGSTRVSVVRCFLLSCAANATSTAIGLLLTGA